MEESKQGTPKAPQVEKPAKKAPVKGYLAKGYKLNPEENQTVHFYMTNFGGKVNSDPRKQEDKSKNKRLCKIDPYRFVEMFKSNFEQEDAFDNLNTPARIISIAKNIDKDTFKERFTDTMKGFSKLSGKTLSSRINESVNDCRQLKMSGSLRVIASFDDILFVPDYEGEKAVETLKTMPEDV